MLSVFCAPSRYVQGREATRWLGDEMKKLGLSGSACIIAGRAARDQLQDLWQETFSESGIKHSVYPFGGECSQSEIDAARKFAKESRATVIIGAGGGKVVDTARAVAADLQLPIAVCPTAASSDAPCSALSVVYTDDGEFDRYIFYKRNPDLVLVDTTVIARSPPRLLVAGMGDALATWFEARTVFDAMKPNQVNGRTSISALALAELCYKTLIADGVAALAAARDQSVTPAFERLVEANTLLSGLGFESGGLAIAHSVHNGLTIAPATHDYLHGEKVAFGLLVQLVAEGKPSTLLAEVLSFSCSVGLPVTLSEVGISDPNEELILKIAERTTAAGETCHNEPFAVTPQLVADAINTADAIGRSFRRQNMESLSPSISGLCTA